MNKREGARGNKRYERTFEVYHFLADRIPFAKIACDSPTLGVPKVVTRRENRSREKERDRERGEKDIGKHAYLRLNTPKTTLYTHTYVSTR